MPHIRIFNTPSHWLAFVCLIILTGCLPTTRFKGSDHCSAYLGAGDTLLLSSLPFDNWEFQLENIRKEFSKRKVAVLYAPQEEFNLRATGVINPLDTVSYPLLMEKGITHILVVREVGSQSGQFIASKTPFELSQDVNAYRSVVVSDATTSSVEIAMHLVQLKDEQDYSFLVTTNVGGVRMQGQDSGATTVNVGGLTRARNVSVRKGARGLSEICR